jgi:hypothetical protein
MTSVTASAAMDPDQPTITTAHSFISNNPHSVIDMHSVAVVQSLTDIIEIDSFEFEDTLQKTNQSGVICHGYAFILPDGHSPYTSYPSSVLHFIKGKEQEGYLPWSWLLPKATISLKVTWRKRP